MSRSRKYLLYGLATIQALLGLVLILLGAILCGIAGAKISSPIDVALSSLGSAGTFLDAAADGMEGVGRSGQSAAMSLQAYQEAVDGLRRTVDDVYTLLGAYRQNLVDADAIAKDVAGTSRQISLGLRVRLPSGIHFERLTPVIEWSVPPLLDAAAEKITLIGDRASSMSDTFQKTQDVLASQEVNRAQLNSAFDQTVLTLREARNAAN
jgi:hypothetical protein